jgi:hypothetical protein
MDMAIRKQILSNIHVRLSMTRISGRSLAQDADLPFLQVQNSAWNAVKKSI